MNIIDLLSDDEDDELLGGTTAPIFASQPRPTAVPSSTSVSAAQPPASQETALGTCTFTVHSTNTTAASGDAVTLERVAVSHDRNAISVKTAKGAILLGHLLPQQAALLAPILDRMKNILVTGNLTGYTAGRAKPILITLKVDSKRRLSNFELEPILAKVKTHLRHTFVRTNTTRDVKPVVALQNINPNVTPSPNDTTNRAPLQKLATDLANIAATSTGDAVALDQKPAAVDATIEGYTNLGPDGAQAANAALRESLKSLTAGLFENDNDNTIVETTNITWEGQHEQLDEMFDQQAVARLQGLPNYPMPKQFANLTLFDYQKQGIRWLIHQERNENRVAPWLKEVTLLGSKKWKCSITRSVLSRPPNPVCGGILADDMGLGKTLQTIGLILSNPPPGQRGYPYQRQSLAARPVPRCTLILCPVSVISNWQIQVNKHVNNKVPDKVLKLRVYHGARREGILDAAKGNDIDILVTSYHTVVADLKKYLEDGDGGTSKKKLKKRKASFTSLFDMAFHRIILDEAHIIRNSKTGFFKAVSFLQAERKLCLTGTPFVNKPDDIHSLLSFLGVQPLSQKKIFKEAVTDQIAERKEAGLAILRTTMVYVALRRKKSEVENVIQLVTKEMQYRKVTFPEGMHKSIHDVLYSSARMAFLGLLRLGDSEVFANFMALLELLLRVRQSCCHADLVPEERRRNATEIFEEINRRGLDNLTADEGAELLERIRGAFEEEEELHECAVCMCEMEEESAVILRECKHIFCQACLNQVRNSCCPFCRVPYTEDDMIKKSAAQQAVLEDKKPKAKMDRTLGRSPKIQAMLDAIEEMAHDEKAVIFSQWTSYLDIIQRELRFLGHTFTRIDGSMSADERIDAMERFDTEGCDSMREPRFILCSLHACGTGINLTRGNVVFMMDTWWNNAVENQACDRVHRIGQTRPVRVLRFLMKNSIEERMVALQDSKAALGKGALEKLRPDEKRKARLTALKDLFEVEDVEELWT